MKNGGRLALLREMQKRELVLRWIRKFVYIERKTVQNLLDVSRSVASALLAQLREEGLIAKGVAHNVLVPVFRLTPKGARAIDDRRDFYEIDLRPVTGADDAGVYLAAHNLTAQRLTAEMWRRRNYEGHVISPRQIRLHGLQIGTESEAKAAWKVPDSMYIRPTTEEEKNELASIEFRLAIEIQQSPECAEIRAYKLWQYFLALESDQIHSFWYVSSYPRIVAAFSEQWRTNLVERTYDAPRPRWRKPENPRKIEADSPILKRGKFAILEHDRYTSGLYPAKDAIDDDEEGNT